MPVKLKCSGCETVLNVPDAARGKVVKCKSCGKPLKVPAGTASPPAKAAPTKAGPAKKAKAAVASNDSGEFLNDLDLDRLEDRNVRVCPKCGAGVGPEDVDCPECGTDLTTGGLGTAQRLRHGRRGAAPSEYYGKAVKDAGRFLVKRQGLAWKSFFVFLLAGLLVEGCLFMIFYSSHTPPRVFWAAVSLVPGLMPFGWVWHLQNSLVKRSLNPKLDKDPIKFEFFTGVSLGIKTLVWLLAFAFPLWLLIAAPGFALTYANAVTGWIVFGVGAALAALTAAIAWPVVSGHMAMPISTPGWALWKAYADVGRNLGPSLFWTTFACLTGLPLLGVLAAAGFLAAPKQLEFQDALAYNGRIEVAAEIVAGDDKEAAKDEATVAASKLEPKEVDSTLMIWPLAFLPVVALAAAPWVVFNTRSAALFVKMFKPNIDLIGQEREYVYVPKTLEEKEKAAKAGNEMGTVLASSGVAFGLALAAGVMLATFTEGTGYLAGISTALQVVGSLGGVFAHFRIVIAAFRESVGWGLLTLFVPCGDLIYCGQAWEARKTLAVSLICMWVIQAIGLALLFAAAAQAVAPEAAPAGMVW